MRWCPVHLALVAVTGCGAAPVPRDPTVAVVEISVVSDAPSSNGNGVTAPAVARSFRVVWSEVTATPGCFFFSGPAPLGRDDTLGTEADTNAQRDVQLAFGPGMVFWSFGGDGLTQFVRESRHEYGGAWRVRERIVLEPFGDGHRGRYHYDEISEGTTTPGRCHIDAVVTLTPR